MAQGPYFSLDDVDTELLLADPERIASVALKVSVVADLLTDTVDSVAGL